MNDTNSHPITIDDLHGFADGQLSPERAAQISVYVRAHPEAARQVADYQAINAALRAAMPLDVRETAANVPAARNPRRRLPALQAMAAVAAGVVIGVTAGWVSHGYYSSSSPSTSDLAQRASAAYSVYAMDALQPVEIAASDVDRLAAWLSTRMKMAFPIPNLEERGFALVGGRLMIGETAPAGLLMYQNGQGQRIVLYVRNDLPADRPTKMHYQHSDAGGTIHWRGKTMGFAVAGALSEHEMMPIANVIRAKF